MPSRANGIRRIVFQSSVGAERPSGTGCGFSTTDLLHELDAIRAGVLRVVLPVDRPMPWVAPRDVTEVDVGRPLSPHWSGRVVQAVHGPALVEAVLGMSTGMRDGFTPEQPRDATTTTPTTVAAWVLEALRPALDGDA